MNENLNLVEILKDCPKGTRLYSPLAGVVELKNIDYSAEYPIDVCYNDGSGVLSLSKDGLFYSDATDGECMLWPSKENRDWSKFKVKKPKFDPTTLHPFDRVLARIGDGDAYCWFADFVSTPSIESDLTLCVIGSRDASMIIPYNDDTKHLVGTTEEAPEFYRYWED